MRFFSLSFVTFFSIFSISSCGLDSLNMHKETTSPDGKVRLVFQLKGGIPYYSLFYHGHSLISPSKMGLRFKGYSHLDSNLVFLSSESASFSQVWRPVWGFTDSIRNNYNQLTILLRRQDTTHRPMEIVFRVYNDGVGFRYRIPDWDGVDSVFVTDEKTQFHIAGKPEVWWTPANYDSYEMLYQHGPMDSLKTVNTPVTFRREDGIHFSLHEADLSDYAGMTLKKADETNNVLECDLVPWPDGIKVKAKLPLQTPWRTIQLSRDAGGLLTSHLIQNLNEPCKIEDTSWIQPMKYVGIWWGMHIGVFTWHQGPKHGATTARAKQYIDFAARHNIPGLLIEGWNEGWETWLSGKNTPDFTTPYPDFDMEEVARYAKEKGVRIIGHHESGGNVPNYEAQLDSAFRYYERLGVRAVKTGYAGKMHPEGQHHHGQFMVNHYRRVVKKAAQHHIMLDVHEPIKPTGISRTWPNMMTREGVRGMEYNAWSEGNPPEHTTILPFTRGLAGPMDYTPGIFDLTFEQAGRPDRRVHTTLAKQLALYVVLYSPLQMAADLIENYENQPAFRFIEDVPVDWSATRVLLARIGDYVAIARKDKHSEDWYIGAVTDEQARLLELPLSFLQAGKTYRAEIYCDGPGADWQDNPLSIEITSFAATSADTLKAALAKGGGMAVRLIKVSETGDKPVMYIKDFNDKQIEKINTF